MKNIPILMYHHIQHDGKPTVDLSVSAASFNQQMKWMKKNGYVTISLKQMGEALATQQALPPKAMVITFDDGYQSVWDHAKPILDRYQFTATVFIVPEAIGHHNLWDDNKPTPIWPCMNTDQCRQLLEQGWEIGAHGLNHLNLTELDQERQREEVNQSKEQLEERFQQSVTAFCYPFGAWNHQVRQVVQQAGFTTACAISPGTKTVISDPWALRRIYVKGKDRRLDFKRKVSNWYLAYRGWRKR